MIVFHHAIVGFVVFFETALALQERDVRPDVEGELVDIDLDTTEHLLGGGQVRRGKKTLVHFFICH